MFLVTARDAPPDGAGYSGTPLPRKLGIVDGRAPLVLGPAPTGLDLGPLAPHHRPRGAPYDVVLLFSLTREHLTRRLFPASVYKAPAGAVWACWPKKSSGVTTDLTENVVREVALNQGLVDVKVCAVDDTWSGLKLVTRLRDR